MEEEKNSKITILQITSSSLLSGTKSLLLPEKSLSELSLSTVWLISEKKMQPLLVINLSRFQYLEQFINWVIDLAIKRDGQILTQVSLKFRQSKSD